MGSGSGTVRRAVASWSAMAREPLATVRRTVPLPLYRSHPLENRYTTCVFLHFSPTNYLILLVRLTIKLRDLILTLHQKMVKIAPHRN